MRRITDLKLLWVEGFMWGPGGPIPIQYGDGQEWIRSQSDTDHNPPPDGKKKEEKERFRFHECLESDCQTNAFQQHPLDLCSPPSGRAIYSLFG